VFNAVKSFLEKISIAIMANVVPPLPPVLSVLPSNTPTEMPQEGTHRITYDSADQNAPATDSAEASSGSNLVPLVPATSERCQLEDFTRCSESHLWKLMMSFYDRKGIESWSQGVVPHFITCNSFIGKAYAKVLQGFIRDAVCGGQMSLDTSEPLYIVELGTGSGKFSYYMLKALEEMSETLDFPIGKVHAAGLCSTVFIITPFITSLIIVRPHPHTSA
jgi:hypothetical protein